MPEETDERIFLCSANHSACSHLRFSSPSTPFHAAGESSRLVSSQRFDEPNSSLFLSLLSLPQPRLTFLNVGLDLPLLLSPHGGAHVLDDLDADLALLLRGGVGSDAYDEQKYEQLHDKSGI